MLALWQFSLRVTDEHLDEGVAYNLVRRHLERMHMKGFYSAPEGTLTLFYDKNGGGESTTQAQDSLYRITITVTSSQTAVGAGGETIPASRAFRDIVVTAQKLPDNRTVHVAGGKLVRHGI